MKPLIDNLVINGRKMITPQIDFGTISSKKIRLKTLACLGGRPGLVVTGGDS